MSNKTTFTVEGIAKLDISQVKGAVDQMKKGFQGITLPAGIDKRVAQIFSQMTDEIAEFEVKSKNATTNADWSRVLSSGQKIMTLYQKLQGQVRQLGDLSEKEMQELFPSEVVANIKKAETALKDYQAATKKNTAEIQKQENELAKLQQRMAKKQGQKQQIESKKVISGQEYTNMSKESKVLGQAAAEAKAYLDSLIQKQKEMEATLNQPSKSSKYRALTQEVQQAQTAYETATAKATTFETELANTITVAKQKQALDGLEQELRETQQAMDAAQAEIQSLGQGNTTALNNLFNALSQIKGVDMTNVPHTLEGVQMVIDQLNAQGLTEVAKQLQHIKTTAESAQPAFQGLGQNIDKTTDSLNDMTSMKSQVDQLKNSFMHFFSLTSGWMLLRRGIRQAYEAVKELDDAMTEIAVVSEYTLDDIWAMRDGYTKAASDMGASTIDLVNATKLYVQQGLDLQQAQEIGIETTKMARIANLDGAEATNLMTAALRGFNMEMSEANRVNDVYSQLAAKSAADTEEIATAMSKTASIAANAGASFENTSAFLTQIIETTREAPETAGTALKTIIARFQELKKAPSEIGEVDGEMVDANKIETALKTAGVELRNAQGEFRNFDDVIIELASKWNNLDVMTQRYIATMAAGSRQQSRFIALMADSERLMELTGYAANSAGASNDQFNKTLDSLKAKINKLKNAWSLYLQNLANNQIIKGVVDMLTLLLETVNKITSAMPGFTGSILQAILTFAAFKAAGALINKAFGAIGTMLFKQGQTAGMQYSTGVQSGLTKGQTGIKNVLKKIRALFTKEKWISKGYTIKFKADPKALVPYKNAMEAVSAAQADYIKTANSATATDVVRQQSEANLTAALASRNLALKTLGVSEAEYNTLQGLGLAQEDLEIALTNKDVRAKLLKIAATEWESEADKEAAISQALVNQQQQMGLLTQAKYLIALLFGSKATRQQALDTLAAAGAMGLYTTADGTATGAQWALNAAIYACPLGWLLVLILAVVAALAVLAIAIENAIETDAERSERLSKSAEAAKEAANEANEAYSTLSDSLKDIQAQQATLDTMTEETLEWKEQVVQLNEQVLELIEKIPELAAAVSLVNGHLTIDAEVAAPILEAKQQDAIVANTVAQIANAKFAENDFITKQKKLPTDKDFLSDNLHNYTTSLKDDEQLFTEYSQYSNGSAVRNGHFLYSPSESDDTYDNKWSLIWYNNLSDKDNMTYEDFKQTTIDTKIAQHNATNNNRFQYEQGTDEKGNAIVTYDYDGLEQKWVFNEDEMERLYDEYIRYTGDKAKLELEKERSMQGYMNTIVAQLDNDRAGEMELAINELLATADLYEKTKVETVDYSDEYLKSALMGEGLTDIEAQGELDAEWSNNDSAKRRLYEEATGLEYDAEKVSDDWFKNYAQMKKIQEVQQDITDEALANEQVASVIKKDYNAIAAEMKKAQEENKPSELPLDPAENISEEVKKAEEESRLWSSKFSQGLTEDMSEEAKNIISENAKMLEEEITKLDDRLTVIVGETLAIKDYNVAMAFANLSDSIADQDLADSLKLGYTISTTEDFEGFSQEEYLGFLQQLNSNSIIAQATAMREGLTSLNPAIKATADVYDKLGGSAFSAEAQVEELYNSLDNDTLAELREDGNITATEMLELAKTNKIVADTMANTGIGASDLADYYNLLGKGLITAADAGTGFLNVLTAINAAQSTIDDSFAFLDTFEASRSETEIGSGMTEIVANFRELYSKGAYSDAALKDYAKAIMGDSWEKIEQDSSLNDKQKMERVAAQVEALPEEGENFYTLWKDFAQNSGTDMVSLGEDNSILFDGSKIENLKQLEQALIDYGYSVEFARGMIADAQTFGIGTEDLFEQISQQDALKTFINQGLISEKDGEKILTLSESQLKLIADKMKISIEDAKKMVQDAINNSDEEISINWEIVYDSEGNLSENIVDEILKDNKFNDEDLDFLIGLGLDVTEAKTQLAKLMTDTNRDFSDTTFGFNNQDSATATSALAQMQNNKLEMATALALMEGYSDEQVDMAQEKAALETERSMATAVAVGMAFGTSNGVLSLARTIDKIFGTKYEEKVSQNLLSNARNRVSGAYDARISKLENKLQQGSVGNGIGTNLNFNYGGLNLPTSVSYDSNGQKTGTTGGGTTETKEPDTWEEDYDWLYNLEKKIAKTVRERNKLENEYNLLLTKGNVTQKALLENLRKQEALENKQLSQLEEERTKRQAEVKALQKEFSDVNKYVSWNSKEQRVVINEEKMRTDQDSLTSEFGERIDKAVKEFERIQDELEQIEDDTDDIKTTQAERLREQLDQYAELESRVVDALVSEREKEIEAMEKMNDVISEANSDLLDKIQTGIDDARNAREIEEAETDIQDMEQRLALMRSDTSGANALDILKLEEELQQARQDLMDSKIDQAIDELSRQNEIAQKQREIQIERASEQLEVDKETGRIADQANKMLTNMVVRGGSKSIEDLLKSQDSWKSLGAEQKKQWVDELTTQITGAIIGRSKGYAVSKTNKKGDTITFTDKNNKQQKGTLQADGTIKVGNTTYSNVFLGADGKYYQKAEGKITNTSKPAESKPVVPQSNTSNGTTDVTDLVKKRVALAIWNNASGHGWGNGDARKNKLQEVFGSQNAKAIQSQVNRGWRVLQKEAGSFKYSDYSYTNMKSKNWKKYETGGLADFTGPAWLDGTKARPEYVLNAEQTQAFLKLINMLGDFDDNQTAGGNNYYDIKIEVDELANDYDVEQLMDKMKRLIADDAAYRNVNSIDLGRR